MTGCLLTLLLLAPYSSPESEGSAEWGHLVGQIVVSGQVPSPAKLAIGQDQQFCGKHDLRDESLQVGDQGGLRNAFVFLLQSRRDRQEPEIHPSYLEPAEEQPVLDNLNCRFEPHAMRIRTSDTLVVKNSDEIGHNAYFESRVNGANKSISAKGSLELQLSEVERIPIKVSCGSHAWMSAYVLIRDEPYSAITDAEGRFEIRNLPAGEWTFQFWHERTAYMTDLEQDGQSFTGRRGEFTVNIRPGQTTDLGQLTIAADALVE